MPLLGVVYVVAKTNSLLFFLLFLLANQQGGGAMIPCATPTPLSYASDSEVLHDSS